MDNPVKSNQKPLRVQKEGWLDWLSYVGFGLSFTIFLLFIFLILPVHSNIFNEDPLASLLQNFLPDSLIFGYLCAEKIFLFLIRCSFAIPLSLIITSICAWKSNYPISERMKKFLLFAFLLSIILSVITTYWNINFDLGSYNIIENNVIVFFNYCCTQFCYLYLLGLFWYIHYFYKKSQDGYRKVWLKVILFTLIPLLSIFAACIYIVTQMITIVRYDEFLMGDVLT